MRTQMFSASPRRLPRALAIALLPFTLLLGSCVNSEPRAELELSYADFSGDAPPSWLVIAWNDGSGEHVIRGSASAMPLGAEVFPRVRTRTSGTLTVRTALVNLAGDTIARGTVQLPLQPDWRWGVDVFAAANADEIECAGCMGRTSFAFRTLGATDSMYVVWGGSSIASSPVY